MQLIKKTGEYTIFRKANNRYAVQDQKRQWINGDAKIEILRTAGLIKERAPAPPPAEEPAASEADAAPDAATAADDSAAT